MRLLPLELAAAALIVVCNSKKSRPLCAVPHPHYSGTQNNFLGICAHFLFERTVNKGFLAAIVSHPYPPEPTLPTLNSVLTLQGQSRSEIFPMFSGEGLVRFALSLPELKGNYNLNEKQNNTKHNLRWARGQSLF